MRFWSTYNRYKEKEYFIDNFLLNNNIIKYDEIIEEINVDTNHTLDGREQRAVAEGTIEYQQDIYKIVGNIEYGINIEYEENLINETEEWKVILEDIEFDNYKKEISLLFDFKGDMDDAYTVFDYNTFKVKIETLSLSEDAPYWGKLLIQAINVLEKRQFDLAFLLIFTAFENFITLLVEDHKRYFYKEINIEKMELKNKMKVLLKHILNIPPGSEEHPSISIIEQLFSDLYKIRNNIAHGQYRKVDYNDCQKCFDLFIIYRTIIKYKPKNNHDLLSVLKKECL